MKKTTLFLVVVLAFSMTPETHGAVTVFGTEAAYNAATGPQIFLINFDGNPSGGTLALGSSFSAAVTFGSPEASDSTLVLWNSDAMSDAGSTTALNGVGPVDGVFTDPVYAFALEFSSPVEAETVYLYDESYVLIDAVTAPNAWGFFGVLSDTPIKKFVLENGEFSPGNRDRFFVDDFRANEPLILHVNIDIKPGSCPNPFNPKSKGNVPIAIVGTGDFDVLTVDLSTIRLTTPSGNVVSPINAEINDSTQPGDYDPEDCYDCFEAPAPIVNLDGTITEYSGDGLMDLVLFFDTQDLAEAISVADRDDCVELTLTGNILDGTLIMGSDSMVILKKINGGP